MLAKKKHKNILKTVSEKRWSPDWKKSAWYCNQKLFQATLWEVNHALWVLCFFLQFSVRMILKRLKCCLWLYHYISKSKKSGRTVIAAAAAICSNLTIFIYLCRYPIFVYSLPAADSLRAECNFLEFSEFKDPLLFRVFFYIYCENIKVDTFVILFSNFDLDLFNPLTAFAENKRLSLIYIYAIKLQSTQILIFRLAKTPKYL